MTFFSNLFSGNSQRPYDGLSPDSNSHNNLSLLDGVSSFAHAGSRRSIDPGNRDENVIRIATFGEEQSGKSTVVNALLQYAICEVGQKTTTRGVNHISVKKSGMLPM